MFKLLLVIIIPALFLFRDAMGMYFYPDMLVNGKEWDYSNAFAMNIYACIIGLSFIAMALKTKYQITYLFIYFSICQSFFDVALRLSVHEYTRTDKDRFAIHIICFILASIIYGFTQNRKLNQ